MSNQYSGWDDGDQHGYGCLVTIPAGLVVWAVVMRFFGLQGVLVLGGICAAVLILLYWQGDKT